MFCTNHISHGRPRIAGFFLGTNFVEKQEVYTNDHDEMMFLTVVRVGGQCGIFKTKFHKGQTNCSLHLQQILLQFQKSAR